MAEQKENCNVLMLSNDMEWMNAFIKGLQRFYLVNEKKSGDFDALTREVQKAHPHFIVVGVSSSIRVDAVKRFLLDENLNIPILAVDPKGESLDAQIKQGADYVVPRRDLLSAVKSAQQIMYINQLLRQSQDAQHQTAAIKERYSCVYNDLPDPIAYVQDGLFLDANPAFLNVFGLHNREQLDEYTLMNFTPPKSERALKAFLKKASGKDLIPAEKIEFQKANGEPLEALLSLAHVHFDGEKALQMYFRTGSGTGGATLDESTKLPGAQVLRASIAQNQEKANADEVLGYWVYLFVENYREVWQRDGYRPAEILMKAVAENSRRLLPPSTEIARFTDDALAMWMTGEKEAVIQRVKTLIARLDELVPENIGRLISPVTYAGMYEIRKESSYEDLVGKGFRAVRALLASVQQNGERVAEPLSGNMSRKDERRVYQIQNILDEKRVKILYQPISSLEADGVARYAERIHIERKEEEMGEELEFDALMQIAERYDLAKQFDYFKITTLTSDLLSYGGDQKALHFYIKLSNSALNDPEFPEWLLAQLKQTGLSPSQVVFEFSVDTFNHSYSGAKRLADSLRPEGAKFALTELARFDNEIVDMLKRLKPEVLKLDMRELDTFEDEEEERFMTAIKDYANEHQCQIIVNHMESPAQLSRVWRYDIQLLQGDGIVPPLEKFTFNFSEPLF